MPDLGSRLGNGQYARHLFLDSDTLGFARLYRLSDAGIGRHHRDHGCQSGLLEGKTASGQLFFLGAFLAGDFLDQYWLRSGGAADC